jgi:predicted transcriptional regulator
MGVANGGTLCYHWGMTLAEALRETITERKLRLVDVASAGGVSESAVRKYLSGGEPTRPVWDRLRRAFPELSERLDQAVA